MQTRQQHQMRLFTNLSIEIQRSGSAHNDPAIEMAITSVGPSSYMPTLHKPDRLLNYFLRGAVDRLVLPGRICNGRFLSIVRPVKQRLPCRRNCYQMMWPSTFRLQTTCTFRVFLSTLIKCTPPRDVQHYLPILVDNSPTSPHVRSDHRSLKSCPLTPTTS